MMLGRLGYVLLAVAISTSGAWAETDRDSGPDTIDVSDYPKEMRKNYALFAKKCSKCHSLARPINARINNPRWWKRYVRKMMRKPGSGINARSGKRIYAFLVFHAERTRPEHEEPAWNQASR